MIVLIEFCKLKNRITSIQSSQTGINFENTENEKKTGIVIFNLISLGIFKMLKVYHF